jgi:hypothetical protein
MLKVARFVNSVLAGLLVGNEFYRWFIASGHTILR